MKRINNYINKFFETRRPTYYIMLGTAVVAISVGIAASATLNFAGNAYFAAIFTAVGLVVFIGLSLIGFDRLGATLSGLLTFGAFVGLVCGVYEHFLTEIQNQAMSGFNISEIKGFFAFILCAALLLILAIISNVLAWMKLTRVASASSDTEAKEVK